jgi:hypothetical protein
MCFNVIFLGSAALSIAILYILIFKNKHLCTYTQYTTFQYVQTICNFCINTRHHWDTDIILYGFL